MNNIKVKIQKTPEYKLKVTNNEGLLQTFSPLTLKNVVRSGINDITEINNVSIIDKSDGAILQYNSETDNYEVKLGTFDGGEF
jgi:DNA-dependent RNA polymerase auxiliary subunit epsilon